MNIGERIQKARERRGLTQRDLAARTGLSQQYLSLLERGDRTNPTLDTLMVLAKALDVSLMALMGREVR